MVSPELFYFYCNTAQAEHLKSIESNDFKAVSLGQAGATSKDTNVTVHSQEEFILGLANLIHTSDTCFKHATIF